MLLLRDEIETHFAGICFRILDAKVEALWTAVLFRDEMGTDFGDELCSRPLDTEIGSLETAVPVLLDDTVTDADDDAEWRFRMAEMNGGPLPLLRLQTVCEDTGARLSRGTAALMADD